MRPRAVHPYAWLWEPLATEPDFVLRAMFGAKAVYLDGRLVLCFVARNEPWRGVLVCTAREHHVALQAAWPQLRLHPILPKWLYLPEADDAFERVAQQLVERVRRREPRIGIVPPAKRTSRVKRKAARPR